jgi:predicted anti-sigma-YlaC factor YlaD
MSLGRPTSHACERAREQLSLELDEQLDDLQRARVESHLATCPACRAFRGELRGLATTLRTAPFELPEFPVVLPRRRRVANIRLLQASAAAAAVALVAGFSSLGLFGGGREASLPHVELSAFAVDRGDELIPGRVHLGLRPKRLGDRIAL